MKDERNEEISTEEEIDEVIEEVIDMLREVTRKQVISLSYSSSERYSCLLYSIIIS